MTNTLSYLLASAYSGISPLFSATSATCMVNGQPVQCPAWLGSFGLAFTLVTLALAIFMIASMWIIFKKAGKPGWAAIVPIYNNVVMLQIVNKPIWWIILYFIPFVNIVISIIVVYKLALAFGKGGGFALGLILLPFIFYPILAFGKSSYMQGSPTNFSTPVPPQTAPPQQGM